MVYALAKIELDRLIAEYESINTLSAASNQSVGRKSVLSESSGSGDDNDDCRDEILAKKQKTGEEPNVNSNLLAVVEKNVNIQSSQSDKNSQIPLTQSASSTSTMTLSNNISEAFDNDIIFESNDPNMLGGYLRNEPTQELNNSGFQVTVLSSLANIQTTNDQILLTMQEILRYNKKIALEKLIAPENLPYFPLKTYDEFLNFELLAKEDPTVNQYMMRRLAALGGSGIEGVTRRIMKFLIANELGLQFNWKGRYHKIGFENTTTMGIVYEGAKLNFPASEKNDMQIAWAVKEWLKHARTRLNQGLRNR